MKGCITSCLFVVLSFLNTTFYSQESSKLEISPIGTLDIFYGYDFNKPKTQIRLPYLYNHNYHNQFAINLGTIGVQLEHKRFTSRLIFQTGSYVIQNYESEPGIFRFIHEANIKCNLGKNKRFSLDLGILPSHIGLESAISYDNPTYTRSIVAEQSPYYMNGLKLNYKIKDSLTISLMALNGWQKIVKVQENSLLSFGSQVNWQVNDKLTFNWSTFGGTTYPDSARKMRYYSDIFGIWKWSNKSALCFGFDIGLEQKNMNSNKYNSWIAPLLILDYAIFENTKLAARCEYYSDQSGVMIAPQGFTGAKILGSSLNLDYSFTDFLKYRLEIKMYNSKEDIFAKNTDQNTNKNIFFCSGVSLKF